MTCTKCRTPPPTPALLENPLVTGDPNIRFYAGAPLLTPEGQPLGTLCTLDTVPRELTEDQREALRILARQVMAHLELRRTRLQLEDERQKLDGVLRMANNTGEALYANNRTEIFVKQDQRLVRIATADLQYVEALGDYVNLHTTRGAVHSVWHHEGPGNQAAGARLCPGAPQVHRAPRPHCGHRSRFGPARQRARRRLDPRPVRVPIGSSYKAGLLGRLNLV